jgi:hypothetical protein
MRVLNLNEIMADQGKKPHGRGKGGKRAERHYTDVITITCDPGLKEIVKQLAWENKFGTANHPNVSALFRAALDFYLERGDVEMSLELRRKMEHLRATLFREVQRPPE